LHTLPALSAIQAGKNDFLHSPARQVVQAGFRDGVNEENHFLLFTY
jgi:hypothetical protein